MSERGSKVTTLQFGRVSAEVALIKSSSAPKGAQHETRRVPKAAQEVRDAIVERAGEDVAPYLTANTATSREGIEGLGAGPVDVDLPAMQKLGEDLTAAFHRAEAAESPEGLPDTFTPGPQTAAGGAPRDALTGGDDGSFGFDPVGEGLRQAAAMAPAPEFDVQQGVYRETDGEWVDLTATLKTIDERCILDGMPIAATVAATAVPSMRVRDAHYVAPASEGAPKVLALVWMALRETRKAALVRWTKKTNQALGALVARGGENDPHLVLLELEWKQNMKPVPKRALLKMAMPTLTGDNVAAAVRFVEAYHETPAIFDALRDERAGLRADVLAAARAGEPVAVPEVVEREGADDELAALFAAGRS